VSGRSEVSGNHTDHNYGKVLAASIDLDIIAIVAKNEDGIVHVKSSGYNMDTVDLGNLDPAAYRKSALMVAGVCDGLKSRGFNVGGFDAYTTSNVFKASGLSSSAAFEDMIGTIQNHLYNGGKIDKVELAKIGQYAENKFYGKPCGLLDQVACIFGGFVYIDFADPKNPVVEQIDFSPADYGYELCIVNTGGNHSDLTDDYAAIPAEMKAVAGHFGEPVMRDITMEKVLSEANILREKVGDRAIIRAMHFINENNRVEAQRAALKSGNIHAFLELVNASGNSSFKYLQNVYTTSNVHEQGISLALAIAEQILDGEGACRVHGGGFAGTVQVFCPKAKVSALKEAIDTAFGEGSCVSLFIRPFGGLAVDEYYEQI
ncbi:MAG: galactokinase, partial [Clostridia bacterium]|nr:galactokinase [Clostridia bacterium]